MKWLEQLTREQPTVAHTRVYAWPSSIPRRLDEGMRSAEQLDCLVHAWLPWAAPPNANGTSRAEKRHPNLRTNSNASGSERPKFEPAVAVASLSPRPPANRKKAAQILCRAASLSYGRGDCTQFEPNRVSEAITPVWIAAFSDSAEPHLSSVARIWQESA